MRIEVDFGQAELEKLSEIFPDGYVSKDLPRTIKDVPHMKRFRRDVEKIYRKPRVGRW